MTRKECAEARVDLHSEYFEMCKKYGRPINGDYAEAVALAIIALGERSKDEL